jgi:hypothetical protein
MIAALVSLQESLPRHLLPRLCVAERDSEALGVDKNVGIRIRHSVVIALQLPSAKPGEHLYLYYRDTGPVRSQYYVRPVSRIDGSLPLHRHCCPIVMKPEHRAKGNWVGSDEDR